MVPLRQRPLGNTRRPVHAREALPGVRWYGPRHARASREHRALGCVPLSPSSRRRTMRSVLSRRMLLRGSTGAALALPLLNDVRLARAQAAPPFPKRLVVVFTPNGTIPSAWASTGSGASFKPGTILQPLVTAGHQNDLVVVQGLDGKACLDGPGGGAHGMAIRWLLTGTEVLA